MKITNKFWTVICKYIILVKGKKCQTNESALKIDRQARHKWSRVYLCLVFILIVIIIIFRPIYCLSSAYVHVKESKMTGYEPTPGQAGAQRAPRNKYSYFPLRVHIFS